MFNLLISWDNDAWEYGEYKIIKENFLARTEESFALMFQNTSVTHIRQLMNYPCLFVYKNRLDTPIYIGWIKNIIDYPEFYKIQFEIVEKLPFIEPIDVRKNIASPQFFMLCEEYQTYWDVANKNLSEYIPLLGQHSKMPNAAKYIHMTEIRPYTSKITSLSGFVKKVSETALSENYGLFFRGHSKSEYKLVPSILRTNIRDEYIHLHNESSMYNEMIVENPTDFQLDSCCIERLVRMQHFSLPTRLLDITTNPLIALYFACLSNKDSDGEVILFKINKKKIKYSVSDTVSCISNLSRLTFDEQSSTNFDLEMKKFNEQNTIKRLNHFIRQEKPYFEERINPDDLKSIVCVKSKKSNLRILSQSGAFLLFGHQAIFSESSSDGIIISKITIPNESKVNLLKDLDQMNINKSTVFPDIESSAQYISAKYARSEINKEEG